MFETAEFIAKLSELSQVEIKSEDFRLPNQEFDKKNPDLFTFSYKKGHYQYNIRTKELKAVEPPQKQPSKRKPSSWNKSYTVDSLYYVSSKGHDLNVT